MPRNGVFGAFLFSFIVEREKCVHLQEGSSISIFLARLLEYILYIYIDYVRDIAGDIAPRRRESYMMLRVGPNKFSCFDWESVHNKSAPMRGTWHNNFHIANLFIITVFIARPETNINCFALLCLPSDRERVSVRWSNTVGFLKQRGPTVIYYTNVDRLTVILYSFFFLYSFDLIYDDTMKHTINLSSSINEFNWMILPTGNYIWFVILLEKKKRILR